MKIALLVSFIIFIIVFFSLGTLLTRILADLLKGWENITYTWGVFIAFLGTVPILVALAYFIALTKTCGG